MTERSRRTFYGDPDDPVEDLVESIAGDYPDDNGPPRDGDELCDGHQAHYTWRDGEWM